MIGFRAFLLVLFVACIVPAILQAQDTPPPHCCGRIKTIDDENLGSVPIQGEFVISLEMLRAQQTTRTQFVDRLSESLFPGKSIDLVIASKQILPVIGTQTAPQPVVGVATDDGLLAIQQTRLYRLPRQRVQGDQLESSNTLYIANGEIYVKLIFVDPSSQDSALQ